MERFTYNVAGRTINVDQLNSELCTALALPEVPGLWQQDTLLTIVTPLSTSLRPVADQTVANHVPNPLFGELGDVRTCRLYLGSTGPTNAQTVQTLQSLIRIVRGIAT